MKLNVGAGTRQLPGFESVDVRRVGRDVRRGHAGNLGFAADGSVDVVFSHAVFEHVYAAHRLAVLREWKRVLAPDGAIVCLGLPDFAAVAEAYVGGSAGTTGPRFDLFEVYRYTHGHPEFAARLVWRRWNPARSVDRAPAGYLPQLHKCLFDPGHLSSLLVAADLQATLVRYAYPGEELAINLGFVAGAGLDDVDAAAARLAEIPEYTSFVRRETVTWHALTPTEDDRLLAEIRRLEQEHAPRWRRR